MLHEWEVKGVRSPGSQVDQLPATEGSGRTGGLQGVAPNNSTRVSGMRKPDQGQGGQFATATNDGESQ